MRFDTNFKHNLTKNDFKNSLLSAGITLASGLLVSQLSTYIGTKNNSKPTLGE